MKSAPGSDDITYFHLNHLPSTHHFMATLFNKLLETGSSPASWGSANVKLIHKSGDTSDPTNFRPIALTSVVGKVFHKILSYRLEDYLRKNNVIDTSIQKGFISNLPGVYEHIYSLSAILQDATSTKKPLMITFLDLKNAFGSIPHQLIFDMLRFVKVPSSVLNYVESFYSKLFVTVTTKYWKTSPIPFRRGVFQGDTMSPIMFLLSFNPLLQIAAKLNNSHGYVIQLPLKDSEDLPPVDSTLYVKWVEQGDEPPGWYRATVSQYFQDGSCRLVYDDTPNTTVSEIVNLRLFDWIPCSKRAKRFVSLECTPKPLKCKWKSSPKFYSSGEHSVEAYADDATLISDSLEAHISVLQQVDQKAQQLDLSFKPSKCVSYLFDGHSYRKEGIQLSGGSTRSITEGGTKFLGKSLDVSLSATKAAAKKKMTDKLSNLLTSVDTLPIRGEYKLWLYRNYIVSLLRFHLSVDAITNNAIRKLENLATRYLKKWLALPRSATRAILYYPGVCCPSVSQVSREAKLSLLSCISATADPQLQQLGLQLHLGDAYLQTQTEDYNILSKARSQLSSFPMARPLYVLSKKILTSNERSRYEDHLDTLSVQYKFKDSACLETHCGTWNRLLLGCPPGQFSFILRAASDTLPTAVNLQRWRIQCDAKCSLCGCARPTTAHILSGCPVALSQERFTYRHDEVLHCLASGISELLTQPNSIRIYADLPGLRASESPHGTIPSSLMITPYRPDIVIYNESCNTVALLELTCPLDTFQNLQSARDRKQSKEEYLQILSELDRLGISSHYDTIELSVLGHYLPPSLTALYSTINLFDQLIPKSRCRKLLEEAAGIAISASRKIFLARDCPEWTNN